MCRFFCHFSLSPQGIAEPLKEGRYSLLRLSTSDAKRLQSDGWGVGWFERAEPKALKSSGRIYREPARVARAVKTVWSRTTVGHIRRASNPLKLPKKALGSLQNSQPFRHGRWLFCHNGTLSIPREVKAELGTWKRFVKSRNDSEVLFYWLLKTVMGSRSGNPAARVRRSMDKLDAIWRRCKSAHPGLRYPYHGLNWVLTDGEILLAFCYANPGGFKQGGALGHKKQPYFALQLRQSRQSVDIASEAWDAGSRWKSLGHGMLLVVKRRKNSLQAQRTRIL